MSEIFVCHPRTQHSQQLAWALQERNLLKEFWSGVPVLDDDEPPPFWLPEYYSRRLKRVSIPVTSRRHPLLFQALWRADRFIPISILGSDYNYRVFHFFDWWVAQHISKLKPKVVVAYENSAYHTFRAAKAIGARCILDAPSFHHSAIARLTTVKNTPYLKKINNRKDQEIALADMILTCSPLAAESYQAIGVSSNKILPMLLGATLPDGIDNWSSHTNPLHFIFAGGIRSLKGIDVILAAFKRIHLESLPYKLSFVGGEGEPGWIEKIRKTPNATYYPGVSQVELYKMLAQADCLLLPSRFDSFGMVVAEAFACGTPAIVSTQTGAKAMIEQFPNAGWIVLAGDEDDLYRCIKMRIKNREETFGARAYALEASRHFTWQSYRDRVGSSIENWIRR